MRCIVLASLCIARFAHATGTCEDTGVRYDPPQLFDGKTQSFAIPAVQDWCEEDQHNGVIDEVRGKVSFVELRDIHNKVLGVLSTATGGDAKRLNAAIGKFEAVPTGKLHAILLARGYAPLIAKSKCKLATAWTDYDPTVERDWRGANVQLEIKSAGKQLARILLGKGSLARRGDQWVRAHVIADQGAIAVFAIVPSCGGPPPGYFEGDGGSCYHQNAPVAMLLTAKATPALAACF